MPEIKTRKATDRDVPGVVECSAALFQEDAGARDPSIDVSWPRSYGPARFREMIDDADRLLLVAEAEGAVVGHLSGSLSHPSPMRPVTVATLMSMYLRPEWRSYGGGGLLVASFHEWARQNRADRVSVTAYAGNDRAIAFYRRNGFEPHALILESPL